MEPSTVMRAALLDPPSHRGASSVPAPIGIGFPYMPAMPAEVYGQDLIDFVEITPEALCRERHEDGRVRFDLVPGQLARARETCAGLPMVVHGVQLSIGSAHGWNSAYLDMLEQLQHVWPFVWHSEHLSFQTIPGPHGEVLETGVPLPMPYTEEAASLIVKRCAAIARRFGVPFLLENPAHYLEAQGKMADTRERDESPLFDEVDFMNRITMGGACRQLLDLHNLHCNAVNHGFDAFKAIDRLALERVTEIHLAGGSWRDGFLMDAHDSVVPQPVWDLLAYVLPRAPNVAGVVFEVLDRYAPKVGVDAMLRELEHARAIWNACRHRRPTPVRAFA